MFVDTCGVVFWVGQLARKCVQRQLDIPFAPFLGNVLEKPSTELNVQNIPCHPGECFG